MCHCTHAQIVGRVLCDIWRLETKIVRNVEMSTGIAHLGNHV